MQQVILGTQARKQYARHKRMTKRGKKQSTATCLCIMCIAYLNNLSTPNLKAINPFFAQNIAASRTFQIDGVRYLNKAIKLTRSGFGNKAETYHASPISNNTISTDSSNC